MRPSIRSWPTSRPTTKESFLNHDQSSKVMGFSAMSEEVSAWTCLNWRKFSENKSWMGRHHFTVVKATNIDMGCCFSAAKFFFPSCPMKRFGDPAIITTIHRRLANTAEKMGNLGFAAPGSLSFLLKSLWKNGRLTMKRHSRRGGVVARFMCYHLLDTTPRLERSITRFHSYDIQQIALPHLVNLVISSV